MIIFQTELKKRIPKNKLNFDRHTAFYTQRLPRGVFLPFDKPYESACTKSFQ